MNPLRTNKMAISDGLFRMTRLLEVLGNPEKSLKVLHIAGTNGKGSTSVMMASVLEAAGYTVGLYTSPHLELMNERIQIWNGEHSMISDEKYAELEAKVNEAAAQISSEIHPETGEPLGGLHFFERITAVAYLYFAEIKPDYVVLECGLGGRLDSTNTIEKPLVSVFTQIGLDHTAELGKTIFKVIREKGGIIKPGVPVVSQDCDMTAERILSEIAKENGCEFVDVSRQKQKFRTYELGMKGSYQVDNAATAVLAIRAAGIEVSEDAISEGLRKAVIPGRFEIVRDDPYWILDGAHNPDAMKAALDTFDVFKRQKKIKKSLIIFGCMQDKNYFSMVQLMHQYTRGCEFASVDVGDERSADPKVLAECLEHTGRSCAVCNTVEEAYEKANSQRYESVLVIGSIYLAGAMRNIIKRRV